MNGSLWFVRRWSPARDTIAHDERGNKTQRAIYRHTWNTGHQLLVFETEAEARAFAADLEFHGERDGR